MVKSALHIIKKVNFGWVLLSVTSLHATQKDPVAARHWTTVVTTVNHVVWIWVSLSLHLRLGTLKKSHSHDTLMTGKHYICETCLRIPRDVSRCMYHRQYPPMLAVVYQGGVWWAHVMSGSKQTFVSALSVPPLLSSSFIYRWKWPGTANIWPGLMPCMAQWTHDWWLVDVIGGICVWWQRGAVSRLVPQLIKNEWKEKGEDPSAVARTL